MAEPINPVTLRGNDKNISVGRTWLGKDSVGDGQSRINPLNLTGDWDKLMQFVIWNDPNVPLGFMVISDEAEYIRKTQALFTKQERKVELRGGSFRGAEQDRLLKISLVEDQVYFRMEKTPNDLLGALFVPQTTFLQGMSHLFPKGEYEIPN